MVLVGCTRLSTSVDVRDLLIMKINRMMLVPEISFQLCTISFVVFR